MDKRKKVIAMLVAIVLVGVVAVLVKGWRPRFEGPVNALAVDLSAPYAYVSTPALSRLPRDLVKAPVVRDVLTEDFAFYYEDQEDRLSLGGAIKRIAYEHETTLPDRMIETALDAPAEVAWWPDAKGAPRYWLVAMTRGVLATALQGLASVAAKDSQLSVVGTVRANSVDVTAYALKLSSRRTLVLLSQGSRVVVLSDPGLLFDAKRAADGRAVGVIASLLSGDAAAQSVYRRDFGLGAPTDDHTIVADARLLSFGYQHFFPGVQALRIDLAAGGASLHTALRVQGANALPASPGDRALWSALPMDPALCTLLPAQWSQMEGVMNETTVELAKGKGQSDWKTFASQFEGPAAICWYARSQLHTPLFVAQTKADASLETDVTLEALSRWVLPATAPHTMPEALPGAEIWQGQVNAPWGPYANNDKSSYKPTLARQGRWISFSPDDKLVERALNTQGKRYPSILDALPVGPSTTLAVAASAQMAALLQREAFAVLPPGQEVLRQAAERHLVPRFDALRKLPAARAVTTGAPDGNGWVAIDWQPVRAAVTPGKPAQTP